MMAGKGQRLFSASDASSASALVRLMREVEAAETKVLKPKQRNPDKGHVYLVKFHEAVSDCYITRMPRNILRLIISYNSMIDFVNLSTSCKPFSRLLADKYIACNLTSNATMVEGGAPSLKDFMDYARLEDLGTEGKRVKEFVTVRPECSRIIYIIPRTHTFFSLGQDCIYEGSFVRYNDSMEIVQSRPAIENITVTDAHEETIICASDTQLAISSPTELKCTRFSTTEPTIKVSFICDFRMIVVLKQSFVSLYTLSLIAMGKVANADRRVGNLYVPDSKKGAFAVSDAYGNLKCFAIKNGKPVQVYESAYSGTISNVITHRAEFDGSKSDFLIVLLESTEMWINRAKYTPYLAIQMLGDSLVASSPTDIAVFTINPRSRSYELFKRITFPRLFQHPQASFVWRVKAVFVKQEKVHWFGKGPHKEYHYFSPIPKMNSMRLQVFGDYVLITGNVSVDHSTKGWTAEVPCAVVMYFHGNAYVEPESYDVTNQSQRLAEMFWKIKENLEAKESHSK